MHEAVDGAKYPNRIRIIFHPLLGQSKSRAKPVFRDSKIPIEQKASMDCTMSMRYMWCMPTIGNVGKDMREVIPSCREDPNCLYYLTQENAERRQNGHK